jgi:hypothetical protein
MNGMSPMIGVIHRGLLVLVTALALVPSVVRHTVRHEGSAAKPESSSSREGWKKSVSWDGKKAFPGYPHFSTPTHHPLDP